MIHWGWLILVFVAGVYIGMNVISWIIHIKLRGLLKGK